MKELKVKDFVFGKSDAYNEYIALGKDYCKEVFLNFPNIDINKLLNGEYYYILGDKGTGKTMLLKYIETIAQDSAQFPCSTLFIRFKKDISDEDRGSLNRIGSPVNEDIVDSRQAIDSSTDCVLAWQLYLIKSIVFRLSETEAGVFSRNETWDKLLDLLREIYKSNSVEKRKKSIIPKVKNGRIELNLAAVAKLNLDLEWTNDKQDMPSFKTVAQSVIDLYSSLTVEDGTLFVFIDEIELSLMKKKQYERDVSLIGDLVFAIQFLSEIAIEKHYCVRLISAIRNEVWKSAKSIGKEINKPIFDFGVQLSWRISDNDYANSPLIKMIQKRIEYSERKHNIPPSNDVWSKYFVKEIRDLDVREYIVKQTWNKPRDVIRLFTIIQNMLGERNCIDQSCFDATVKDYAAQTWSEFSEELSAVYSAEQIDGMHLLLNGISIPFSLEDFNKRMYEHSKQYPEVKSLESKGAFTVLRTLYDVGVIGNYARMPRFAFSGDTDISPDLPITITYPMIRFFKAQMKSKK